MVPPLPPKRGPPFKPEHPKLTTQVALQAAMSQAAGAGKATSRMLKNSIVAATVGTEHEGKFNADYHGNFACTFYSERIPEIITKLSHKYHFYLLIT